MITKICAVSGKQFVITDEDLAFYEKVGVPVPTLCPEERQRRRLAWQNMYKLYHRTCDATGKKIISNYSSDKPFRVYDNAYWWSDSWDAREYGRDFDFSRPFFEQFAELLLDVPHPNLDTDFVLDENADFCNFAGQQKNCYLVFHSSLNEDCYYGTGIKASKDCVDSWNAFYSELLYECIDCLRCYNLKFSQDCQQCRDSWFLKNCVGCSDCFGCMNLRKKQYWLFNKEVGKAEYEKFMASFDSGNADALQTLRQQFIEFQLTQPHRAMQGLQHEHCSGDHISKCKHVYESFDVQESEDMKFCERIYNGPNSDCYDVDQFGLKMQEVYEGSEIGRNAQRILFTALCKNQIFELYYCMESPHSQHCFGCVSLQGGKYCILNKQYSKEEYFQLRDRIIEHMKKTPYPSAGSRSQQSCEWGEFFPIAISPFAYNETVAAEYYPLAKGEVLSRGWQWKEEEQSFAYDGPKYDIPNHIDDVENTILEAILTCEETGKHYRIVKPELSFYRTMRLPIPRVCPDVRHEERNALRNPRQLFLRQCAECRVDIQTTFAPDRKEQVLCEACYLKVVQ